jgi:hypothetical protein
MIAVDNWQKTGGDSDLLAIVDHAIDALADGLRDLEPSTR